MPLLQENCCIFWGYTGILRQAVDYFLASNRRQLYSSIYLFTYDSLESNNTAFSPRGERIYYVSIKSLYKLKYVTSNIVADANIISYDSNTFDCDFAAFTLLSDRASIVPTSQISRIRQYSYLKKYFYELLALYKKVFVYFESCPHYPAEYVLEKCAGNHSCCNIYFSHDTTLSNYFFVTKNLQDKLDPLKWVKHDDSALLANNCSLLDWLPNAAAYSKTYFSNVNQGSFRVATGQLSQFAEGLNKNSFELMQLTSSQYIHLFRDQINAVAQSAANDSTWNSGLLMSGHTCANTVRDVYEAYVVASFELLSHYNAACLTPEEVFKLVRNSCYVPLHYQPERSTFPDGDLYFDQIRFIQDLRGKLSTKYPILIKEHPTQFVQQFPNPQCGLWRKREFYDELKIIPNTHLVPFNVSQQQLIFLCRIVATVTGTSGWQSLMLGKKAVYGGYPWYGGHPSAYRLTDIDSIDQLMMIKDSSGPAGLMMAIDFFSSMQPSLHRAGFNETETSSSLQHTILGWGEMLLSLAKLP